MGTPATRAKAKYNKENYEQILTRVPKEIKALWQTEAQRRNMSLSQFIQTAVNLYIKNCPADELPSNTNETKQEETKQ